MVWYRDGCLTNWQRELMLPPLMTTTMLAFPLPAPPLPPAAVAAAAAVAACPRGSGA